MFGAHLSIAGGLTNALDEAERLRFDCVQVFTKNQRQWRVKPLDPVERDAWLTRLRGLGWNTGMSRGRVRVVSHNSYLINLASPDAELRGKSRALQREELERCEALGIPLCVAHPGAHLGDAPPRGTPHDLEAAPSKHELAGLRRIVRSLDAIHRDLSGCCVKTCLETTVGSGTNLGYAFHHLGWIRNAVREPERMAFCLDTCHVHAAGYDLSDTPAVLQIFEREAGLDELRVLHINDSVGDRGSRTDRHAGIGQGTIPKEAFRVLVNRPALRGVPKVLETPKGETAAGTPMDLINIRRLKRLIGAPLRSR